MQQSQPGGNPSDPEPPRPASPAAGQQGAAVPLDPAPTEAAAGTGAAARHPGTAAIPGYDGATSPRSGLAEPERRVTRAGMIWAAVASALVVLVLLIVFILQNQELVQVKFFGLEGAVSLGISLFIAAVGGGVLVAMAGAARIIQLRAAAHRHRVQAGRSR
ncbi:LapA family protein [Arthrobacter globiformis]|uniref:LapA family protein n=1 Tax=Arthrobacter globiformis TaxID=1665 RepID=UPI00279226D5|nr:lipopolysaccharide assembly protein LapA domain-containing protein [Arthrobacter globiformis]MDQ0619277.1 putative integral membrane protein [Arthrobacter globiformis]